MFKLDDNLLRELGLGSLPPAEKNRMLGHIYETLEMRVGMTLANQMTDAQLTEFESFIDGNDEAGALKWLESNFPNYKQVVADELEKLKVEIKAAAPQIIASSQQAGQMPSQAPPQMPADAQSQMPPAMPPQPATGPQPAAADAYPSQPYPDTGQPAQMPPQMPPQQPPYQPQQPGQTPPPPVPTP